jgi:NADPH-dependent curcumin reductase CurA
MSDMEQYMPPVPLGDIMRGGVVGTVVASRNPALKVGAVMGGLGGWTDYVVTDGTFLNEIPPMPGVPLAAAFGNFFIVGATAYFGLMDIGQPKPGETVVVSAAAGAVGSLVCQLAKMKGCRVIGIAGSDEKCRWLTEVAGIDGAINYKREDVGARLDALCPKGIDINFENVGGEIMEAVMARMNNFGRMALCGMISTYNATTPMPGPRAWPLILMHRLKVQGFIVSDYADRYPEAIMTLAQGMMSGQIKTQLDVRQGLDQAVNAVRELYTGGNNGKLMVAVHPEG